MQGRREESEGKVEENQISSDMTKNVELSARNGK